MKITPGILVVLLVLLVLLLALAGCATFAPAPTASPLRLPTRAPTRTLTPTLTLSPVLTAQHADYQAGVAFQRMGDLDAALQSLSRAIQQEPDFAPAYIARSGVYLARGEFYGALADAEAALRLNPHDAAAHALRGETLRLQGRPQRALEAFDTALALDPGLWQETFRSRWLAALTPHNRHRLLELSREYVIRRPDDPLRYYYRGQALLTGDMPRSAIRELVRGIAAADDPPALLWFTLGQAYLAEGSWQNAVIALEMTRSLVQTGDASLHFHSDQPIAELFDALGRAYLHVQRCSDAQVSFEYAIGIGAPAERYVALLEEAVICQTPTVTPTPYFTLPP